MSVPKRILRGRRGHVADFQYPHHVPDVQRPRYNSHRTVRACIRDFSHLSANSVLDALLIVILAETMHHRLK